MRREQYLPYRQTGYTFGSDVRDKAIMLQAMVYLNMQQDAWQMLEQISAVLSSQEWLSTQTTAFALVAATAYIDKFVGKLDGLNCEVTTGGHTETVKSAKRSGSKNCRQTNPKSTYKLRTTEKVRFIHVLLQLPHPMKSSRNGLCRASP